MSVNSESTRLHMHSVETFPKEINICFLKKHKKYKNKDMKICYNYTNTLKVYASNTAFLFIYMQ